jgi:uncharacterized coiled-coil DUF342 family protein
MPDNENKFWAFIIYSQQDNCEQRPDTQAVSRVCWGHWLHDALKAFSIPLEFIGQPNGRGEIIPERIHPVYQDEQEQPENVSLSAETRRALEQSICLVVICSPRSGQSLYVNEVVRYFKQIGRGNNILPIVIAGEPNVSDGNLTAANECFVPALRHPVLPDGTLDSTRRAGKSVFVDARYGADKREILANDHRSAQADLEMAKIQLIALVIGVGFNGLWWREQKRHFVDFATAQDQAREALNQVAEVRRQLEAAQRQALENPNLSPEIHGQIQEAQNQAREAQAQAREVEKRLQEIQNLVRDTQAKLEEAQRRALAAEGKVLESQDQAREAQVQLEQSRNQAREAQNKILTMQNLGMPDQLAAAQNEILKAQGEAQVAQSQLIEVRQQAQEAQNKFQEAQKQVQEVHNQAQAEQTQLEVARQQFLESESKIATAQNQAREAQEKFQEIQNQTRDAHSQVQAAQNQLVKTEKQRRIARRLNQVFAALAVIAFVAVGIAFRNVEQQRQVANQALAKAVDEAAGKFAVAAGGVLEQQQIKQTMQNIGGVEQDKNRWTSLEQLAGSIPPAVIPEALKTSAVVVNDQQRSYFQKCLLVRLGGINPMAAMTNASAIEGIILNDEGKPDSSTYFQLAVLDGWMQTDLSSASNWVLTLHDTNSQQRALEKMILWLKTQPDSETKNQTLATCVLELANTDYPKAFAFAESLPEGEERTGLISSLVRQTGQFANLNGINTWDVLPETIAPWPWTTILFNTYSGLTNRIPQAVNILSLTTNSPTQSQLK